MKNSYLYNEGGGWRVKREGRKREGVVDERCGGETAAPPFEGPV
jgi:hypothetical protein